MDLIQNIDIELFYLINHFHHSVLTDSSAFFIDVIVGFGLIFISAFLLTYIYKREKFVEFFVLGTISIVTTYLLSSFILKNLFQRLRPADVLENVILIGESLDKYSMPSSHTAVIFSFLMVSILVFGLKDRFIVPILALVAILTATGRVYVGHHYPSDVIVGALIGLLIGSLIYYVVFRIMKGMFDDVNESHF